MKYGLEFAGPRRVRRVRGGWGRTAIDVVVLLLLAALCGWLLHLWRGASDGSLGVLRPAAAGHGGLPLAMWAWAVPSWPDVLVWLAWGVVTLVLFVMALTAWWAMEEVRVGGAEDFELADGGGFVGPVEGQMEEVVRIVEACRVESRAVLMLIEATLRVEDCGEALDRAHERQAQVVRTLGMLRQRVAMLAAMEDCAGYFKGDEEVRA